MHADKTNRSILVLLSLILIAAGAVGFAAGIGGFGSATRHGQLTHNRVGAFVGEHGDWVWPAAALVVLVVVVLAARWLLALLFTTDRAGQLGFRNDTDVRGRTSLSDTALTSAVIEEVKSYRGVNTAHARLIGDREDPSLVVAVTLEQSADVAALRSRIENEALTHARQATGKPDLPIRLDLSVTTKRAARTV